MYFVYFYPYIIFELCYICQPFFIRFICVKLPMKKVFRNVGGIPVCFRTALRFPFDRWLYSDFPADSQDPLIIGRNPIIYSQFITDTPIPHIWMQLMYFPDNIGNLFIPDLIVTFWMFQPSVIRRTSNSKVSAHLSDRISLWFGQFPDCLIFT